VTVLLGLAALAIILWAINGFVKSNPQAMAKGMRTAGGFAAIAGAVFLASRGELQLALPLGAAGFGLLGWSKWGSQMFGARTQKSAGQASRVRSAFFEMELDHDTGAMRGQVLAGRYKGQSLDALDLPSLLGLVKEVDEESRGLLAAYLDRRQPGWREHADGDTAAGQVHAPRAGKMTAEEAQQILGVAPGATAEEIGRAHRNLMKRLHPDQGGSTYLASRVNEAREVLLGRHR
jgi:DnaJ-domain-containing protein 1